MKFYLVVPLIAVTFLKTHAQNNLSKAAAGAPAITSFSPKVGVTGTIVTINGSGFTGATAVSFGAAAAGSFTIVSASKITAVTGNGSTGRITIATPNGSVTTDTIFNFCVAPSITIHSNTGSSICAGTKVTFTAGVVNSIPLPIFHWKKNGVGVGINSAVYVDSTLATGDTVICQLTTNGGPCIAVNTVNSNKFIFNVAANSTAATAVVIAAGTGTEVCQGTNVKFTATPVNGGAAAVYHWSRNGANVGTNSSTYIDSLAANNDSVSVSLTSGCPAKKTVVSNIVGLTVDSIKPIVSITSNPDSAVCKGHTATFTASVKPSFQWFKNGEVVGTNSNKYADRTLTATDVVECHVISASAGCNNVTSNILNSNQLKLKINLPPARPSAITGPTIHSNIEFATYSVVEVPGVTYIWSITGGALINSGQGSNTINMQWGGSAGVVSVVAANGCGSSAPSTLAVAFLGEGGLTGTPPGADKNVIEKNDVQLYPNPARSIATLQFTSKKAGKYMVTVIDENNNVIEMKSGVSVQGTNTLKLNTSQYARGMYFVTITDKENGQRRKELVIGE